MAKRPEKLERQKRKGEPDSSAAQFATFDSAWMPLDRAVVALPSIGFRSAAAMCLKGTVDERIRVLDVTPSADGTYLDAKIDRLKGVFVFTWIRPGPREIRNGFSVALSEIDTVTARYGDLISLPDQTWAELEVRMKRARQLLQRGFNEAVARGDILLRARETSPLNKLITDIPADVWQHLAVINWQQGVAQAGEHEKIFSVHARLRSAAATGQIKAQKVAAYVTSPAHQAEARARLTIAGGEITQSAVCRELAAMFNAATPGAQTTAKSVEVIIRRHLKQAVLPPSR